MSEEAHTVRFTTNAMWDTVSVDGSAAVRGIRWGIFLRKLAFDLADGRRIRKAVIEARAGWWGVSIAVLRFLVDGTLIYSEPTDQTG